MENYNVLKLAELSNLPVFDFSLSVRLANNKKEIAEEILGLFMQEFPADLEAVKMARKKREMDKLLRLVHKIHGALCYCGMPRLKNIAVRYETLLKQELLDETAFAQLGQLFEFEGDKILNDSELAELA